MRILILSLTTLILCGCAGQDRRDPPDWLRVAVPQTEVTYPAELPLLCEIKVIESSAGKIGTWSPDCWKALAAYEATAQANTKTAQANAAALRKTEGAYTSLIKAGEMQQELTDFYSELYKDEKRGRFYDSMIYRVLIAAGLIAAF